ncbi:hypothetical protein [uncultured Robinsoniella sp.]|uniref:hypothetical protein n=1 Tax=uncultured Robinsoniella sp. TaxID=904190 RepID=UPI00290AF704|nr:hypothetical protein [Clostridiales bacterium]
MLTMVEDLITGMGFIGCQTGMYKMAHGKKNSNLIEGATPPLTVSPKWKQMRGDGSITVHQDHFVIRNNGINDWNKWYYTLPENIKKIRVACAVNVDGATTSPDAKLCLSLNNIYDEAYQVYSNKTQTGWVYITKEITLSTPYIGFLLRGANYVAGQIYSFNIKDLLVEKIE